MKKQYYFLMLFMFAVVAISNNVSGQAVKWSDPIPLVCDDDALHPIAGKLYEYEAVGTPTGGTWRFWATKDQSFITSDASGNRTYNHDSALGIALDELIATSANYNDAAGTPGNSNVVEITWSSSLLNNTTYLSNPTFVVAYYVDVDGCTNNIRIWELDPRNGFTVDVLSMDPADFPGSRDDYAAIPEQCPDIIESATYSGGQIQYDFGTNYLYFELVAANFSEYWVPTVNIDAATLGTSQTATVIEYTLETPDTWGPTGPTWLPFTSGTTQIPVAATQSTENGVSVFIRVTVENNQYENIAGQTLILEVDGENAEGIWDVLNTDCSLPAPNAADQADTAQQIITPRPNVEEGTQSTIPANQLMIPGNNEN